MAAKWKTTADFGITHISFIFLFFNSKPGSCQPICSIIIANKSFSSAKAALVCSFRASGKNRRHLGCPNVIRNRGCAVQNKGITLRTETSFRFHYLGLRSNLTLNEQPHRRQLSLTEGESYFLPFPGFFFWVSSVITKLHNTGFVVFLHFLRKFRAGQLGLLSINFNFRSVGFSANDISLCLGEVQMKIYERSWQAVLFSAVARSHLTHSGAHFARPNGELACMVSLLFHKHFFPACWSNCHQNNSS